MAKQGKTRKLTSNLAFVQFRFVISPETHLWVKTKEIPRQHKENLTAHCSQQALGSLSVSVHHSLINTCIR